MPTDTRTVLTDTLADAVLDALTGRADTNTGLVEAAGATTTSIRQDGDRLLVDIVTVDGAKATLGIDVFVAEDPGPYVLLDVPSGEVAIDLEFDTAADARNWLDEHGGTYRTALYLWNGRHIWPVPTSQLATDQPATGPSA